MANNRVKMMILADMMTRCLIGEFPDEEDFMKTLENYKTRFSVQVPKEYNENFKDMANDLANVLGKYFE
jgi:hypothetical protein